MDYTPLEIVTMSVGGGFIILLWLWCLYLLAVQPYKVVYSNHEMTLMTPSSSSLFNKLGK
jgi:hypothetical protein